MERKGCKVVSEEGEVEVGEAGSDDDSVVSDDGMDPVECESKVAVVLQPRASRLDVFKWDFADSDTDGELVEGEWW